MKVDDYWTHGLVTIRQGAIRTDQQPRAMHRRAAEIRERWTSRLITDQRQRHGRFSADWEPYASDGSHSLDTYPIDTCRFRVFYSDLPPKGLNRHGTCFNQRRAAGAQPRKNDPEGSFFTVGTKPRGSEGNEPGSSSFTRCRETGRSVCLFTQKRRNIEAFHARRFHGANLLFELRFVRCRTTATT